MKLTKEQLKQIGKEELEKLARQRRGPNDWKSNITDG